MLFLQGLIVLISPLHLPNQIPSQDVPSSLCFYPVKENYHLSEPTLISSPFSHADMVRTFDLNPLMSPFYPQHMDVRLFCGLEVWRPTSLSRFLCLAAYLTVSH